MAPQVVERRDKTPRRRRTVTVDAFTERVTAWWDNKQLFDRTKALLEGDRDKSKPGANIGLRVWVLEEIKRIGQPDEKGNRFHYFPSSVNGLAGLKAQYGSTPLFNEERTKEILTEIGPDAVKYCTVTTLDLVPDKLHLVLKALQDADLMEECVESVGERIDQDKVWAWNALHKNEAFTDEELDEITPLKETWSLIPIPAE